MSLVLRPSEILLETRSARSKIWVLKLARSLELLLGLSTKKNVNRINRFAEYEEKGSLAWTN